MGILVSLYTEISAHSHKTNEQAKRSKWYLHGLVLVSWVAMVSFPEENARIYIYIYIYKRKQKQKNRKKLDMAMLGFGDPLKEVSKVGVCKCLYIHTGLGMQKINLSNDHVMYY